MLILPSLNVDIIAFEKVSGKLFDQVMYICRLHLEVLSTVWKVYWSSFIFILIFKVSQNVFPKRARYSIDRFLLINSACNRPINIFHTALNSWRKDTIYPAILFQRIEVFLQLLTEKVWVIDNLFEVLFRIVIELSYF